MQNKVRTNGKINQVKALRDQADKLDRIASDMAGKTPTTLTPAFVRPSGKRLVNLDDRCRDILNALPKLTDKDKGLQLTVTVTVTLSPHDVGNLIAVALHTGRSIEDILSASINSNADLCDMSNDADNSANMAERYGL
jgi:hypothetical protein